MPGDWTFEGASRFAQLGGPSRGGVAAHVGEPCAEGVANEGRRRLGTVLDNGEAADRFGRMVRSLGGPKDLLERPDKWLPVAPVLRPVEIPVTGYVSGIDVRALGVAVVGRPVLAGDHLAATRVVWIICGLLFAGQAVIFGFVFPRLTGRP